MRDAFNHKSLLKTRLRRNHPMRAIAMTASIHVGRTHAPAQMICAPRSRYTCSIADRDLMAPHVCFRHERQKTQTSSSKEPPTRKSALQFRRPKYKVKE